AVLGNADNETPDRSAYLLAMDSAGLIDSPKATMDRLVSEPSLPYSLRSNISAILRDYDHLASSTHLIVISFGDLARADRYTPLCLPALAERYHKDALHSLE